MQNSLRHMPKASRAWENIVHETNQLEGQENAQAGVFQTDEAGRLIGCIGRTHRAVLPAKQNWVTAVFLTDDASLSFHAPMVHTVRSGYGRDFL